MAQVKIDKTFPTMEQAEEFKEEYYNQYHPAGYGTTLSVTKQDNGTYRVTGYRSSSCD